MLKEKTMDVSELSLNNAVELEWRKISDPGLLETMLSQVDSFHTSNSSGKYSKHCPTVRCFTWHTLKPYLPSLSKCMPIPLPFASFLVSSNK